MRPTSLLIPVLALTPALAAPHPFGATLRWIARQEDSTIVPGSTLSTILTTITTSTSTTAKGLVSSITSALGALVNADADVDTTPVELNNATIDAAFVRAAQFAQVAYCSAEAILSWKCGPPCDNLPGVKVLQAGGDDGEVPGYFIAQDTATNQIIVAHQGTNSKSIISIANDAEFLQLPLNRTLFPQQWSNDTKVHSGFQATQQRTADSVLSGVQNALASTGLKDVFVIGHSLGAAVAVMDSMMLKQNLDPALNVNLNTVVFGLPRGGNQQWADLVDNTLGTQFAHVTNQNDPVPTVPPQFVDYVHPKGEVHIADASDAGAPLSVVNCPGQENDSCSTGNSLFSVSVANHQGPYFRSDIIMAGKGCPL